MKKIKKQNFSKSLRKTLPYACLIVMVFSQLESGAQTAKKSKTYIVVVNFVEKGKTKAVLYRVNDTSIEIRNYSKSNPTVALDSQVY